MTYYEERQEVERKKNEKLERELAFNKQFRARVQDEAMHDALFMQGFNSVPIRRM